MTNDQQLPLHWAQGEHLTVIGDTGTGKTYLMSKLAPLRRYVVILRTKPDDIKFPGFKKVKTANALNDWHNEHILLEPVYEKQATEGAKMLDMVWEQGGWTVFIDEHWYSERLGLKPRIERLLTQGRSKGVSVVTGMQRPVQVSRFTLSQSTHVITFRVEPRDLKTLAEATTARIIEPIEKLNKYEFVYFHRGNRIVASGTARSLARIFLSKVGIE
jgi:hypothetical protein